MFSLTNSKGICSNNLEYSGDTLKMAPLNKER